MLPAAIPYRGNGSGSGSSSVPIASPVLLSVAVSLIRSSVSVHRRMSQQRFRNPTAPFPTRRRSAGRISLLSIGTMKPLRLPMFLPGPLCSRSRSGTLFVSCVRVPLPLLAGGSLGFGDGIPAPGLLFNRYPFSSGLLSKEIVGSPNFRRNPCMPMPCSSTPARLCPPSLLRRFVMPPLSYRTRARTILRISRLNHAALAPAVYASCRHCCRRRKTRLRWLAMPCRTGLFPSGSNRRFRRLCVCCPPSSSFGWRQ